MHNFNYNKDVLPRRTRSSGKLRLPSIKLECRKKSFFKIMVVYFLIRFRFQRRMQGGGGGGGGKGRVAMPHLEVFELAWLPMSIPFSYQK